MNWRTQAASVIAGVIQEVGRDDEKKLRAALRKAYPFGERAYHPYKIWLSEIRRQIGEPSPTMSVAEALRMEAEIWNGDTLNLSEMDCLQLKYLGEELSRCAPLLNASQVMIREKDAKFLRRLAAKVKSKAPAPASI